MLSLCSAVIIQILFIMKKIIILFLTILMSANIFSKPSFANDHKSESDSEHKTRTTVSPTPTSTPNTSPSPAPTNATGSTTPTPTPSPSITPEPTRRPERSSESKRTYTQLPADIFSSQPPSKPSSEKNSSALDESANSANQTNPSHDNKHDSIQVQESQPIKDPEAKIDTKPKQISKSNSNTLGNILPTSLSLLASPKVLGLYRGKGLPLQESLALIAISLVMFSLGVHLLVRERSKPYLNSGENLLFHNNWLLK